MGLDRTAGSNRPSGGTLSEVGAIYTVGHGARSLEEFVALLHEAGIQRLVDVRTAPGSRKHPNSARTP